MEYLFRCKDTLFYSFFGENGKELRRHAWSRYTLIWLRELNAIKVATA